MAKLTLSNALREWHMRGRSGEESGRTPSPRCALKAIAPPVCASVAGAQAVTHPGLVRHLAPFPAPGSTSRGEPTAHFDAC